jgi:hypothetical protein
MPKTAKRPQATIATQRHLCLPIGGEGQEQETETRRLQGTQPDGSL